MDAKGIVTSTGDQFHKGVRVKETWKLVEDWPMFEVSNMGGFRRVGSSKNLSHGNHSSGYVLVGTKPNGRYGKPKTFRVHQEVAKAFIGPKPGGNYIVNHKNCVREDNRAVNLEWVTHKENYHHAKNLGRMKLPPPTDRKLSKDEIRFISENYKPYDRQYGARALGRKFGVNKSTIILAYNRA